MILFLTSSPCIEGTGEITPANGFRDKLLKHVTPNANATFITATPDDFPQTEWAAFSMKQNLEEAGLSFSSYNIIDWRNQEKASGIIATSDFIILGGGHVPTQNRFFHEINLPVLMKTYDGVVMGISAGTMNCAETVYAEPEEPGESDNSEYQRFIPGLGLTTKQVLPHFQKAFSTMLDGKRLIEDIILPDSHNHTFYGLPDGSYIFSDGNTEELRGEVFILSNGNLLRQMYT